MAFFGQTEGYAAPVAFRAGRPDESSALQRLYDLRCGATCGRLKTGKERRGSRAAIRARKKTQAAPLRRR